MIIISIPVLILQGKEKVLYRTEILLTCHRRLEPPNTHREILYKPYLRKYSNSALILIFLRENIIESQMICSWK